MDKSAKNTTRRSAKESFSFEGIESSSGTIFPDTLLDRVMPFLTPAEWKTCSYIIRRTFGWKKEEDDISLDQVCNGISRRDGSKLDHGTQMDKKTVIRALKGLESKGVIIAKRNYSNRRGFEATTYSLRFKGQSPTSSLVANSHKSKDEHVSDINKLKLVDLVHKANGAESITLVDGGYQQTRKKQEINYQTSISKQEPYQSLWTSVLDEIQRQVPKHSFDTWLRKSHLVKTTDRELVIAVSTKTQKDWIEKRFGLLVRRVAQRVSGEEVLVKFVALEREADPAEVSANVLVL